MELKQLTSRIYYTENDPERDRPVLGYILGDSYSVMVDAGNSPMHAAAYNEAVKQTGFPLPAYCILTHWHWDHTFGMHSIAAETIAHEKTNQELNRMAAWKWDDASMQQRLERGEEIAFADTHIRAEYHHLQDIKVVPSRRVWEEGLRLDCGSIICHCIHLPSAHSDDSLVIFIPEEKVLFIGDIYNDDFYHNHSRNLEKTKQLYEALAQIDFTTAIPGHSAPVKKENLLAFLAKTLER